MEKKEITEILVHNGGNVSVYGRECVGCKRHGADIMVSVSDADGNIFDLFLASAQASRIADRIMKETSPMG